MSSGRTTRPQHVLPLVFLWSNLEGQANYMEAIPLRVVKEGVFLRNISAAPICDHSAVMTPGNRVREVGLF